MSNDIIDTQIELELYKIQSKSKMIDSIIKGILMMFALVGGLVVGLVYNGDYATYAFMLFVIVISYAINGKTDFSAIKDLFTKNK